MSKVDALRAMREARYAARVARGSSATAPAAVPSPGAAVVAGPDAGVATSAPPAPARRRQAAAPATDVELCGHRNLGDKSCRRPAGHAEKSHRYR